MREDADENHVLSTHLNYFYCAQFELFLVASPLYSVTLIVTVTHWRVILSRNGHDILDSHIRVFAICTFFDICVGDLP